MKKVILIAVVLVTVLSSVSCGRHCQRDKRRMLNRIIKVEKPQTIHEQKTPLV